MRRNLCIIETTRGPVAYRKGGDGQGQAMVFVHGAVGDSRLFRHQLKTFGQRQPVIAIDLPGHGYSTTTKAPDMDDFVAALLAVCAAEGITHPVLCGHSMGGGVVLEMVSRRAIPLAGLVLIATAPVLPVSPELIRLLRGDSMEPIADLLVGSVFSEKVELLVGFARKGLAAMDPSLIRNDVALCRRMDYREVLPTIAVPTMIVANEGDAVIPWATTAAMARDIPGARLALNKAPGHVPFFEQWQWFNEVLAQFLASMAVDEERPRAGWIAQ